MAGSRMTGFLGVVMVLVAVGVYGDVNENFGKTLSPYFVVDKAKEGETAKLEDFPLKKTDVRASVCGVIADVAVTQHYQNTGTVPINAQYVFPASSRAAVHGMKMTIGEYQIVAKVKEREQAKKEFKKAKKAGKSASLLEQQRPNVFTMNVANIMPGDNVFIELKYTEMLVPTDGIYQFVYPTVVGPRYSTIPDTPANKDEKWLETPHTKQGVLPKHELNIVVKLVTGVPINKLNCLSHKVEISWEQQTHAEVFLSEEDKYGANRDFILSYSLLGKKIQSGLMVYEGEKENYFVVMTQPPERVESANVLPREYIFVVDVSGSMDGFPLETAKKLLQELIGNLNESDCFNVIFFAGGSQMLSETSLPATKENIQAAVDDIDHRQGGGGTELASAMKRVMALPAKEGYSRSILVITDGYIAVEKEVFKLISENLDKTNVFAFGIGSGVNRYLIEGIARTGLGEPFVVTDESQAQETALRFRDYIQYPVMTNISVEFEGVDVYDLEPQSIPDMFAQRPIIIMGKWRGDLDGAVYVKGRMNSGDYEEQIPLNVDADTKTTEALRYLWARTRLARLADFNVHDDQETRKQIVALGLAYNLLTKYTSFIAVLEKIRNPLGKSKDVKQPLPLPKGVSNMAVGKKVPEPDFWILALLAGIGALFFALLKRRRASLGQ